MAPTGPGKRKRGDRSFSGDSRDEGQRPSPHRPGNLNMAQQPSYGRDYSENRGRGRGRGGRGGRGGYSNRQPSDAAASSQPSITVKSPEPTETAMTNSKVVDKLMLDSNPQEPEPDLEVDGDPYEPNPNAYDFITDEIVASWEQEGKATISEQGKHAISNGDEMMIATIVQELIHSALALRLPPTEAAELIKLLSENEFITEDDPNPIYVAVLDHIAVSGLIEHLPPASAPSLRRLLSHSGIDPQFLRRELDANLLIKLGLLRDTFGRMSIRKATNVLYKQSNYNLMREESEGFAKLMTELFTITGNEPPTADIVEDTVEKVKAMIGAFDLDVGRTLDVVLDVFGAVLIKQFRFFVKFLRASPWWPRDNNTSSPSKFTGLPLWANRGNAGWTLSDDQKDAVAQYSRSRDTAFWPRVREVGFQAFFEAGRTRAPEELVEKASAAQITAISDDSKAFFDWINKTKTLPPTGNRDAAQLLGFKLRFYSSSAAREESDRLPDNLIHLSALLIKINFISLKDLYPHFARSDEDMEQLRQQKVKEKADRDRDSRPGAASKNALLMAGALSDDTLPPPREATRVREAGTRAATPSADSTTSKSATTNTASEPEDQTVALLKSLLAHGALPEALFIIGRFPWILELYPEIPEYINRILHQMLSGVYSRIQPLASRASLQQLKPTIETDVSGLPKGQVRHTETPAPKVLKWAFLDRSDHSDGQDYRFYWEEWSDNIPVCQDIDDIFTLCQTFLNLVGFRIGQDAELLTKFARIGKHSLKVDNSESNRSRWLDLIKRILLPALSFTKSNASVVNEVYDIVSTFPISTRYLLYLEWTGGRVSRLPEMRVAVEQARAETRDVLKRISKTNVKSMARQLAKVAYANPHVVITTAMGQIEAYDGIAEVFIEGVRYFTDLGYDVLTWAMISSMAREGRSRTQDSGLFTSKWLIALASFGGKICKRYGMMKPGPILKYVAEQLGSGNLTDLVMLEQIVLNMGGITTDTNYNDAQLQAMGGGELLQSQTRLQLLDLRHDKNVKITTARLMRELRITGLTGKLLVSMAQQRQACVFDKRNSDAPLKLLGNIFDEVHRIMIQYLDLLLTNLRVEDFRSMVPEVSQLLFEYGICPEVAFTIARPAIRSRIVEFDKEEADRKKDGAASSKEMLIDEDMEDAANGISEEDGEAADTPDVTEGATPSASAINDAVVEPLVSDADPTDVEEQVIPQEWHPVLKDIMDKIHPHLPEEVIDLVGVGFFTTFWQLSLYDIAVASDAYNDEIKRLTARVKALNADRSNAIAATTREKEKQKKDTKELIENLMSENRQHIKASNVLKRRLELEKKQWFVSKAIDLTKLNEALMENCFLPRLLCSSIDSYFCFKFVKYLHSSGTPNFQTLAFYELLFKSDRLASLIFACTSNEADNLGRFFNEVLRDFARWHQTKSVYEKEAWGSAKDLPGFALSVKAGKPLKLLHYEDFRRKLFQWHQKLHGALITCLSSTEYMHVRNAISILRAVSKHFPAIVFHGTSLRKSIEALADSDKEDLKLSSKAILSELNKREKVWVIPQAFRKGKEMEKPVDEATKKAATPQPPDTLNAEAPGFKPSEPPTDAEEKKTIENNEPGDVIMTDTPLAEPPKQEGTVDTENKSDPKPPQAEDESKPGKANAKLDILPERSINGDQKTSMAPRGPSSTEPRRGDLPRRPSPVRNARPSPSLPSRPEPSDRHPRRRDEAHLSTRPPFPTESARLPPDTRQSDPLRHSRPDDRSRDPHYDRGGPYPPRGHDRDDRAPLPRGSDIPRIGERDHVSRYGMERGSSRPDGRDSASHTGYDGRHERPRAPVDNRYERDRPSDHRSSDRAPPAAAPASSQQPAVTVNPDRAALIGGDAITPRDLSIKGQAQEKAARGPRPSSPKPTEDRRYPPRHERGEESRYDRRQDPNHQPLGTGGSPIGPRPPRQERSGPFGGDSRPAHRQPIDMQHGRLEQDSSSIASTSQAPDEAPSGPRGRVSTAGPRSRGEPMAPINTAVLPSPNTIPTGPSRLHGRNSSYHDTSTSSAPPSAPVADTTSVHPSRLNLVGSPTQEAQPRFQQPQQQQPQPSSATASSPPMGPRSAGNTAPANAPTGPSPTTRGPPPSGPGMNSETGARSNRNGRHPITAVNNHLEQAGRGGSTRGRGGTRQNSLSGSNAPGMPPPSPATSSQPDSRRPDLFSAGNGSNGAATVPNGPPLQTPGSANERFPSGRPAPNDRRGDLMDDQHKGEIHHSSRHSSRERGPERDDREGRRNGERGGHSSGYTDEPRRSGRSREHDGPPRSDDVSNRSGYGSSRGGHGNERGGYGGGERPSYGPGRGDPRGQKHGREGEGNPYAGPTGHGGRGGMRSVSDNKRPRRGG